MGSSGRWQHARRCVRSRVGGSLSALARWAQYDVHSKVLPAPSGRVVSARARVTLRPFWLSAKEASTKAKIK